MKLADCEVLPGIVINVSDPEKRGRIKASVPTWFDTETMDEEALPWIEHGPSSGYQRFSKLENGTKVYVFRNLKNKKEFYYLPMLDFNDDTKSVIGDYTSSEVLLSRTTGPSGSIFIYYNDKDGLVEKIGETSIQITPNKEVHISDGKSSINLVGGNITIGRSEDLQQAVLGEKLKDLIQSLGGELFSVGTEMSSMPFVSPLGEKFIKMGTEAQNKANEILSDTVKISS